MLRSRPLGDIGYSGLTCAPFREFESPREEWAKETAFVYPGPIQYWGPSSVCDRPTKTILLEHK